MIILPGPLEAIAAGPGPEEGFAGVKLITLPGPEDATAGDALAGVMLITRGPPAEAPEFMPRSAIMLDISSTSPMVA